MRRSRWVIVRNRTPPGPRKCRPGSRATGAFLRSSRKNAYVFIFRYALRVLHRREQDPARGDHAPVDDHTHREHHDGAHDVGRSRLGRAGHAVSGALGAHTHVGGDHVDAALDADSAGRRALLVSLAILVATAGVQLVVVAFSGSVALLGDGLHNIADALTAVPLLVAFGLARRPATSRYTYGYGRAEDLGGLVVVVVIALSGAVAAFEAVDRLLHPRDVTDLWAVAAAAVVGFAGNEIVARLRIRVGRRIGSAALVADGLHARTDGFVSLGVLLGAGGVALGWRVADPIAGLVIAAVILGVLRAAVRHVGARLLDAVDPELVDRARAAVTSVPGISDVREIHIRWIGHTLRAEVDATVDPALTVGEAHDLAHHAERHLLADVSRLTAATIHTSPAGAHR